MNLAENRQLEKTRVLFGAQKYKGLSKIRLSKYKSVHKSDGSIIPQSDLLYVEDWVEPEKIQKWDEGIRAFKQFTYYLSQYRRNHGLSKLLQEILELYSDAIDERTIRTAFLKLWTLAEKLTLIGVNESHAKIVDRMLKFTSFEDKAHMKMILNNIRLNRNALVHDGIPRDFTTTQTLIYQLHDYLHFLISVYLINDMEFENFSFRTDKRKISLETFLNWVMIRTGLQTDFLSCFVTRENNAGQNCSSVS